MYEFAGGTVASGTELAVKTDCVSCFRCLTSGKILKSKSVRSNLQAMFQLVPIDTVRICPPCSCKRYSASCIRFSGLSFIHTCIRYRRNEYGTAFFRNGTETNFCLLPYTHEHTIFVRIYTYREEKGCSKRIEQSTKNGSYIYGNRKQG